MPSAPSRTLQLLELLQRQPVASGSELAKALGVDRRTVRRHIRQLELLGIPVIGHRGRDGGYALQKGFRLPPLIFGNDEAVALVIGLHSAADTSSLDLQAACSSALAKLERILPDDVRRGMRALDRAVARSARERGMPVPSRFLTVLGAAVDRQQCVDIDYGQPHAAASTRRLDPYGLVHVDRYWYVVGFCHLRVAIRSFRLDRIRGVRPMPQSFGRPEGFDAMDHLRTSIRDLPRAHLVEVCIDGPIEHIRPLLDPVIGRLEPAGKRTRLTAQIDDLDWLARELSRLPFAVDVSAQPALRRAWRAHLRTLLRTTASSAD